MHENSPPQCYKSSYHDAGFNTPEHAFNLNLKDTTYPASIAGSLPAVTVAGSPSPLEDVAQVVQNCSSVLVLLSHGRWGQQEGFSAYSGWGLH